MFLKEKSEVSFQLNVLGSIPSHIILWIGLASIAGIGTYWFLTHFFNAQYVIETINNDLFTISKKINENCDANYYYFKYNPRTEEGKLIADSNEICIKGSFVEKCADLLCGPKEKTEINLKNITYIEVTKNEEFHIYGK